MSERFGVPGHAPQHAPDHAPMNPTPPGDWASAPAWPTPDSPAAYDSGGGGGSADAGGVGGSSGGSGVGAYPLRARKSTVLALVLAMLFGPLGLFYVSVLNGIAALIVLPAVVPFLVRVVVSLSGASGGTLRDAIIVATAWSLCIPWAVLGVRWRNRRIDRVRGAGAEE